jgi:hypothetical protein
VLGYIVANRKEGYKGLHTVYGKLNSDLRVAFPSANPVTMVQEMEAAGLIEGRPAKGGHMIFLPGEMTTSDKKANDRIAKAKEASATVASNKVAATNGDLKDLVLQIAKSLNLKL